MKDFGPAFGVANAVLYEGYLLYPYTASTGKNRVRWQFGVVVPEAYLTAETGEHAEMQTEVLFECPAAAAAADVDVLLRFLQVESRTVEVPRIGVEPGDVFEPGDGFALGNAFAFGKASELGERFEPVDSFELEGTRYLTFDEAVEREILVNAPWSSPAGVSRTSTPLAIEGGRDVELLRDADGAVRARIVRERWPLRGTLEVTIEPVACDDARLGRLRVRLVNRSEVVPGERSAALRTSFVSTHTLLAIGGGTFLSVLDPPAYASTATAALVNRQTFPVLVGDGTADPQRAPLVLSSPIILYDFPALGAQTEADAFDATEIDELLTLSVLSLSDRERAEARATDPRARAIVERAERFGPEAIARLHAGALHAGALHGGAVHASDDRPFAGERRLADPFAEGGPGIASFGDPLSTLDLPAIDCVFVAGTKVARGSSVRLHPTGRADIWDSMLDGKIATVRAIHQDFEERMYVAVTVDDDPASELHDWYGRAFFFSPEEVEPLASQEHAR
jgi:hypothetical protein